MPLVTVVIPTYNRADMVKTAIDSVLAQTFGDYEIIVVDDCSVDNTREAVASYGSKVKFIQLDANSGSSARPRNTAIRQARGKYIALLDSDDIWMPSYLEKVVAKAEASPDSVGLVYAQILRTTREFGIDNAPALYPDRMLRGNLWPLILSSCICATTTSLIKKSCFDKVGLFDDIGVHWEMWIRLAKHYEFDYVDEVLAINLLHELCESNKDQRARLEYIFSKHAGDYAKYPAELRVAKYQIARHYLASGEKIKYLKYSLPYFVETYGWYKAFQYLVGFISPGLLSLIVRLYGIATFKRYRIKTFNKNRPS